MTTYKHHPYQQQHLPYHLAFSQLLCRYRSKVCNNPRAHKRDGSLHRYCEEHRQRANTNQKKWAKRRMELSDERELRHMQLSYQQLLRPEPMQASQDHLSTDVQLQTLPTQATPVQIEESFDQWMAAEFPHALPLVEDDLVSGLLWGSLGLDELNDDVQFQL